MVVGQAYPIEHVSQIKPFDADELVANLEKGVAGGDPSLKQHLSTTTGMITGNTRNTCVSVPYRCTFKSLRPVACGAQTLDLHLWNIVSSGLVSLVR
jgi:hypothetical protein